MDTNTNDDWEEQERKRLAEWKKKRAAERRKAKRIIRELGITDVPVGVVEGRLDEYKTEKGLFAKLRKMDEDAKAKHAKPEPGEIRINVEWRHSRTWGNCPTAEAEYYVKGEGWCGGPKSRAGGCGYDKHSTVLADVLNPLLVSVMWKRRRCKKHPYGIQIGRKHDYNPYLEGGVGVCSTSDCMRWLGYEVVHREGRTWDYWQFTKKGRK